MRILPLLLLPVAVIVLTACASHRPPVSSTEGSTWVQKGYVSEVRDVTENDGRNAALGTILGSVIGGIAGSSIGGGYGRALSSAGGAVAGGLAGQQAGRSSSSRTVTRLTVRKDGGESATYYVGPEETFHVGDEVKIISRNGILKITH